MSREKHNIQGYEERDSMQLAGRIVILAEKSGEDDPYMIVNCKWDNPVGANEYYDACVTSDYLEAVREFVRREALLLDSLEAERSLSGLPFQTLTADDCVPKSMNESIIDKIVVVKPAALAHEYRSAEYQLMRVDSGNGAIPDGLGQSVFCTNLYNGNKVRHARHQIAGVIDPAKIPEWANAKLEELQAGNEKSTDKAIPAAKKPTFKDKLDSAKETAAKNNTHGGKSKKRDDAELG